MDQSRAEGVSGRLTRPAEKAARVALLVGGDQRLSVVGRFRDPQDALKAIGRHVPGVAPVDIALPRASGLAGIRLSDERAPELVFLMLSLGEEEVGVPLALRAGPVRACDGAPPLHPLETLRAAVHGRSPMSGDLTRHVLALLGKGRSTKPPGHDLTAHESRLLRMLVDGHTYRSIARELSVSVNTVAFHIKRVYEKLDVHSKSQAVAKALRDGMFR